MLFRCENCGPSFSSWILQFGSHILFFFRTSLSVNFLLCRHFSRSSSLLLRISSGSASNIVNFSFRQRLHWFDPLLNAWAFANTDHLTNGVRFLCLSFHMYVERVVWLLWSACSNVELWEYHLNLNFFEVQPM